MYITDSMVAYATIHKNNPKYTLKNIETSKVWYNDKDQFVQFSNQDSMEKEMMILHNINDD